MEPDDDPVPRRSSINVDSVESVSVAVLVERLGRLSDDRMREVCAALDVAVENATTDIGLSSAIPTAGAAITKWFAHRAVSPM